MAVAFHEDMAGPCRDMAQQPGQRPGKEEEDRDRPGRVGAPAAERGEASPIARARRPHQPDEQAGNERSRLRPDGAEAVRLQDGAQVEQEFRDLDHDQAREMNAASLASG